MRGQLVRESHEIPEWLQLGADETLLFSAETDRHVQNPIANVAPTPEAAILTDRRLICLAHLKTLGRNEPVLTTMPLSAVQAIQTTRVTWNVRMILLCIFSFVMYILPGVIFLFWMNRNLGAHVNVVAGNLRTEIKFHPEAAALPEKFLEALDAEVSRTRS